MTTTIPEAVKPSQGEPDITTMLVDGIGSEDHREDHAVAIVAAGYADDTAEALRILSVMAFWCEHLDRVQQRHRARLLDYRDVIGFILSVQWALLDLPDDNVLDATMDGGQPSNNYNRGYNAGSASYMVFFGTTVTKHNFELYRGDASRVAHGSLGGLVQARAWHLPLRPNVELEQHGPRETKRLFEAHQHEALREAQAYKRGEGGGSAEMIAHNQQAAGLMRDLDGRFRTWQDDYNYRSRARLSHPRPLFVGRHQTRRIW